jgi:Family of unknown function (DUF6356)
MKWPGKGKERNVRLTVDLYDGGMDLRHTFTDHPASVGETWGQHCRVALGFSRDLALAAGAAAVHAVVPSLCATTASRRICALHERMTTGARAVNAPDHLTAVRSSPSPTAPTESAAA